MSEMQDKLNKLEGKLDVLSTRVELLEIIAKSSTGEQDEQEKQIKVTQINMNGKKFICITAEEESIFRENNPKAAIETYHLELPQHIVSGYMNDPENNKQFTRKETVNA